MANIINGTSGDDNLNGTDELDIINGLEGNDTLSSSYGSGGDVLNGGAGNDTLYANFLSSDTTLNGGSGNDILRADSDSFDVTFYGGTGNDHLHAGSFANTYLFNEGDGDDTIYTDSFRPGAGADVLRFGLGIYNYDINSNRVGADLILSHRNGIDQLTVKDWYMGIAYQLDAIEFANGSELDLTVINQQKITINGTIGDDTLTTDGDNSTLNGNAGNDILRAYLYSDGTVLHGGAGDDQLYGSYYGDTFLFNLGDGQDTIYEAEAPLHDSLGTMDVLVFGEDVHSQDISSHRNNDDFIFSHSNGTDEITIKDWYITPSYDLSLQLDVVEFADGTTWTDFSGSGTRFTVNGTLGNDSLFSSGADNVLDGREGADHMYGGLGNDNYVVDNVGDVIVEYAASGWDRVYSSVDFSLAANTEQLFLVGNEAFSATGNEANNYLYGNNANNVLDGREGVDHMYGGLGNDNYVVDHVDDVIVEYAASGWDRIYSSVDFSLAANTEQLVLLGNEDLSATGNTANNYLYGNNGHNVLDGKEGADHMYGGLGNDNYVVNDINDVIIEYVTAGWDRVYSSVDFSLAINTEQLFLVGNGNINATGNNANNYLTGNSANNQLQGGLGNDTLTGGAGSDTYIFELGDGQDILQNFDAVAVRHDVLNLGNNITAEQLAFSQVANDLMLSITGSDDSVTIEDWFSGEDYQLDAIVLGTTGVVITNDNIDDFYGF